jgi:hypothetical protein
MAAMYGRHPQVVSYLEIADQNARALASDDHFHYLDIPSGKGHVIAELLADKLFVDDLRCELGSRHELDIEGAIGLLSSRIVESGNSLRHTKDQLGDLNRHRICVVRIGGGDKRIGKFDARFPQHSDVVTQTLVRGAVEGGAETLEDIGAIVDN